MTRARRRNPDRHRSDAKAGLTGRDIDGLIVIDKPRGLTSAQVVARVKSELGAKRAGHTGTLDPLATGVLPVCLGSATRLAEYLLADDKGYEGVLRLGVETDTLDSEGQVTRRREAEAREVTPSALSAAMAAFVGACDQVPPMYSAIKRGGRPLYELARAGQIVERAPRRVRIDRFELLQLDPPRARFAVDCSKGTYVRSLVADLGERLGCGAHLQELRRTRSGVFTAEQSVQLSDIKEETLEAALVLPADAVAHLPGYAVAEELIPAISCGQRLPWSAISASGPEPDGVCRLLGPDRALLAMACVEGGRLRFERVFAVRA